MNFKNHLSAFLLILFISVPVLSQDVVQGMSKERLSRIDGWIQTEMDKKNIPGAVAMVSRNGEVVYEKAFGYSNLDKKVEMANDNIFYIQSMTKPVMTVAFMMLYEEGYFQLTDPVHWFIPAFKDLKVAKDPDKGIESGLEDLETDITIEHLLTHTSGMTHGLGGTKLDQEFIEKMFANKYENISDRLDKTLEFPLVSQPGAQWYYSMAPDALSVLIEKFSGMSTNDFLQQRLFDPLGMDDTGYNVPKSNSKRVVQNTHKKDGTIFNAERQVPWKDVTVWSGVNALFSTPSDYMKFCHMLQNGGELNGKRYLSRKTLETMTLNHTGDLFGRPGEGFGHGFAVVDDLAGTQKLGSEGLHYWGGAFNTHFFVDPKEKISMVFFSQTEPFTWYFHDKMRQLVYQAVVD